jgi:hypothetical protein
MLQYWSRFAGEAFFVIERLSFRSSEDFDDGQHPSNTAGRCRRWLSARCIMGCILVPEWGHLTRMKDSGTY